MNDQQRKYISGVLVWSLFVTGILFLFICLFAIDVSASTIQIGIMPLISLLLFVNMALTAILVRL